MVIDQRKTENDLESPPKGPQGNLADNNKAQMDTEEKLDDLSRHRFECQSCSYVYDPDEGVKKFSIPVGTPFLDLDPATFRCPVCRVGVEGFKDIGPKTQASGFQENMSYGFGVNTMTPAQKNVLIFGGLAFAFACFLSLYSLH